MRKSINRLMDMIRCNATDSAKCKWLTVTYADVMTNGKQAFLDAQLFLRKLRRIFQKVRSLLSTLQLQNRKGKDMAIRGTYTFY